MGPHPSQLKNSFISQVSDLKAHNILPTRDSCKHNLNNSISDRSVNKYNGKQVRKTSW